MNSLTIQFHATPEEMVQFSIDVMENHKNLFAVYEEVIPSFSVRHIVPDEIQGLILDTQRPQYSSILFFLTRPNINAATQMSFRGLNSTPIFLQVGRLTVSGLEESSLSIMKTDDAEACSYGRKIARLLKKTTFSGVTVFNPNTGIEGKDKNRRYTVGVQKLFYEGVKILPFAGACIYRIDSLVNS